MKNTKLLLFIIIYLLIYSLIFYFSGNNKFIKSYKEFFYLLNLALPAFILSPLNKINNKSGKIIDICVLLSITFLFFPFKRINGEVFIMTFILFLTYYFYKFIFIQNFKKIESTEYELINDEEAIKIIENEKIASVKKENEEKEFEIKEITSLYTAVKDLSNTIKIEDTMEIIFEILKKIFKYNFKITTDDIYYILIIKKEFDFMITKTKGFDEAIIKENEKSIIQSILNNISPGKGIIYKTGIEKENTQTFFSFFKSVLFIPLYAEKKLFGVLFIAVNKENIFNEKQLEYFKILSNQFAISLENAYLYEEVEQMSITDSLTGLYVHRYFQDKLENELKRTSRYSKDLSLVIADIDFFKKVNDTYGHLAGDYILKTIALIMKNNTTPIDTVARYGGEEFVIIFPDIPKDKAHMQAVKIRKEIENYKFKFQNFVIKVTISMGVASYPADALTRRALIEKADKALYRAKQEGRNRVVKI